MSGKTVSRKFSLANFFGLLLLGLLLLIILGPMFLSCGCRKGELARAVQNAKQVGYALFNFENDFGCYPNDESLKKLDDDAVLSSAGGSNYYFSS